MPINKMKKILLLFFLQGFVLFAVKAQYSGGTGNGFSEQTASALNLSLADSLYNGGTGKGDDAIAVNSILLGIADSVYKGGTGKGEYAAVIRNVLMGMADSLYNGGSGKGEIVYAATGINLTICTDTLYWNGNDNIDWDNPNNWDCGTVPGNTSFVIIPSGRPRYPVIFTNTEIRKLELRNGAAVIVFTGKQLTINGH
jgi:hypothetical protein